MSSVDEPIAGEPRILVVDDHRSNLITMEAILRETNHAVVLADSGPEALRLLMKNDFAAVLLDITMPGMDGFEVAALIRGRERSAHTPILFVTAHNATEEFDSKGYSLGAVDYIFTPVVPSVLRAKIAVFVDLDRKRRQVEAHSRQLARLNRELERRVAARTAQLQAANDELISLTHSISHDLRTPLRHITMLSEVLSEVTPELAQQPAREHFDKLRQSAVGMNTLFEGLLAFFRVGRTSLNLAKIDNDIVVREVADSLAPSSRALTWDIAPLPASYGDALMIRQVWTNLLSNAVKYSARSERPRIEIGATQSGPGQTFYVRDNGVGFDSSQATRLFGVFQRLHGHEFDGAGVGLAIVDRIVRRHGGGVWAEGAIGRGATFHFSLPSESAIETLVGSDGPSSPDSQEKLSVAQPTQAVSILLVEDSDEDAATLERSLRERGFRGVLVRARDGVEALARLRGELRPSIDHPTVIVADVEMPRMDGLELLRRLRSNPEHQGTIVFIHGAGISLDRRREAYAAHATAVVDKLRSGEGFRQFARMLTAYVDCMEAA